MCLPCRCRYSKCLIYSPVLRYCPSFYPYYLKIWTFCSNRNIQSYSIPKPMFKISSGGLSFSPLKLEPISLLELLIFLINRPFLPLLSQFKEISYGCSDPQHENPVILPKRFRPIIDTFAGSKLILAVFCVPLLM